jgi:hypothetical protein
LAKWAIKRQAVTEFQFHKWLPTQVIPTDRVKDQDPERADMTRKDHIQGVQGEARKDQGEGAEVPMIAMEKDGALSDSFLIRNLCLAKQSGL